MKRVRQRPRRLWNARVAMLVPVHHEKRKKKLKNDQEPVELNAHFSRQPSSSNARNLFHLKLRKAKFTFFQNERPLLVGHLCQVLCCQFIQFFI